MKLVGKAQIAFYHYIANNYEAWEAYDGFGRLPDAMQWGVYVDFFDSVGIEISASIGFWDILTEDNSFQQEECETKTRSEARAAAIEKACEIYNSRS